MDWVAEAGDCLASGCRRIREAHLGDGLFPTGAGNEMLHLHVRR